MINVRFLCTCVAVLAFSLPISAMGGTLTLSMIPSSQYVVQGRSDYAVTLTLTTTTSVDLGGFNIGLTTDPGSGITFTNGDSSVTNYVFEGNSIGMLFTPASGSDSAGISDYPLTSPQTLTAGTYGLGEIFFNVAANAPLGNQIFTLDSSSSFSDGNGDPIAFSPVSNSTLGAVDVVPEPSSLLICAIGIATGLSGLVKNRRIRRTA